MACNALQVLTYAKSYAEAVDMLKRESLTAPVYFITAGSLPNQGAILTRDRNKLADALSLNTSDIDLQGSANRWYLLQTNYVSDIHQDNDIESWILFLFQDRWKQPDADDDRRYYGNLYMNSVGQIAAAQFDGLLSILSTWPLTNSYTSYTAVMMPGEYDMESFDVYTQALS